MYIAWVQDGLAGPTAEFLSSFGIDSTGAVLVRPDGFVAWRVKTGEGASTAKMESALDHIVEIARNPASRGSRSLRHGTEGTVNAANGLVPVIYFIKCTPQAARVITTVAAAPKAITLYEALRAADSEITRLRFQRAWQAR